MIDIKSNFIAGKGDALYSEVLIKGTNISVREILRQLSTGKTYEEVLAANPDMTIADIHTCFEYAFQLVGAMDFKKALAAINVVDKKREKVLNKLDSFIANPEFAANYFSSDREDKSGEQSS